MEKEGRTPILPQPSFPPGGEKGGSAVSPFPFREGAGG